MIVRSANDYEVSEQTSIGKNKRSTKHPFALPLMPQDPFFEQPFGQYAPAVASMAARTVRILTIVSFLSAATDQSMKMENEKVNQIFATLKFVSVGFKNYETYRSTLHHLSSSDAFPSQYYRCT